MTPISIVTTHYLIDEETLHLSTQCLERIKKYTHREFELIIVENGTENSISDTLHTQGDTYIGNKLNLGNPRMWDQGVSVAKYDTVILMDNDVWVEEGWETAMVVKLIDEEVGITFPYSIVGDELDRQSAGLNVDYKGRRDGFCFAFRKETYQQTGPFLVDQPYKLGYYEDDWFEYRVQYDLGLKLVACPSSKVWHKGRGTSIKMSGESIEEGILANREWYETKTNGIYPYIMEG